MPSFWNAVNRVIQEADIVLEVLDARFVDESRNAEIEEKVESAGKQLMHVINKSDLVDKSYLDEKKKGLSSAVFVSCDDYHGFLKLKERIMILAQRQKKEHVVVAVVGYPNTGKSSIINVLAGRKKAGTSARSGFTRGIQKVRISEKVVLLDSPGVIPFLEKDEMRLALLGSKNFDQIKDPILIAGYLLEHHKDVVSLRYDLPGEDGEEMLDHLAQKKNFLKKGGHPDTERAAREFLKEWQTGVLWKRPKQD